jgi:hypothetical protein
MDMIMNLWVILQINTLQKICYVKSVYQVGGQSRRPLDGTIIVH